MKKNNFNGTTIVASSSPQTQKIGEDFAKFLEGGDVVCLYGDLGFGKTTFAQGLAKGLGIKKRIISPTFVMVRSYELRARSFYHIDLYRTENEEDIGGLGIEEVINNKNNIVVIEWAEKLKSFLPEKRIDIKFSYEKDNEREITFRSFNQ